MLVNSSFLNDLASGTSRTHSFKQTMYKVFFNETVAGPHLLVIGRGTTLTTAWVLVMIRVLVGNIVAFFAEDVCIVASMLPSAVHFLIEFIAWLHTETPITVDNSLGTPFVPA